jgi:hypothetical protein
MLAYTGAEMSAAACCRVRAAAACLGFDADKLSAKYPAGRRIFDLLTSTADSSSNTAGPACNGARCVSVKSFKACQQL